MIHVLHITPDSTLIQLELKLGEIYVVSNFDHIYIYIHIRKDSYIYIHNYMYIYIHMCIYIFTYGNPHSRVYPMGFLILLLRFRAEIPWSLCTGETGS